MGNKGLIAEREKFGVYESVYNTDRPLREVLAEIDAYVLKEREFFFDNPPD